MSIFYYAVGGGLGHLSRALAVHHTLTNLCAGDLPGDAQTEWLVLTSSAAPPSLILPPRMQIMQVPATLRPADFGPWLQQWLLRLSPELVILDAFPMGIFGEWCGLHAHQIERPPFRLWHLARLLDWPLYARRLRGMRRHENPRFYERIFLLEPVSGEQMRFLESGGDRIEPLFLKDPPLRPCPAVERDLQTLKDQGPVWGIVHAGDGRETGQLLAFARELAEMESITPGLVLFQPPGSRMCPGAQTAHTIYRYPLYPLLPVLDRVISGCGFNTMRQVREAGIEHRFMPFERALDDQFARAAYHRPMDSVALHCLENKQPDHKPVESSLFSKH